MKPYAIILLVLTMLALVLFQGFQCASSEFTGAKLKMTQKNYKEAKRLLEIEVQKTPGNDEAWYLLGALCSEDREYVRMNEAFNKHLELSDKHAIDIRNIRFNRWGVHLNMGVRALERATPESTAYFDESIEEFSNAAAAWPDTSLTYRYLGYSYNNKATSNVGAQELKTGMTRDEVRTMIGPPSSMAKKEHKGMMADAWFYEWAGATLYFVDDILTDWDKSKSLSAFDAAIWAFREAWQKGKDIESLKRMARIYVFRGDKYKNSFESDNETMLKAVRGLAGIGKSTSKNDVISALGAPDNIRRGARGTKKETFVYSRYNLTLEMDNEKVVQKTFAPTPYEPAIDSSGYHSAMKEYNEAIQSIRSAKIAGASDASLKVGMTYDEVEAAFGRPDKKVESVYENLKAIMWVYAQQNAYLHFVNERLKGWRRETADEVDLLSTLLQAYVQSDRITEAIGEYEQVTKAAPENKTNHYILGVLYRSALDYKGAVAEFEKAYALDPSYSDALFDLGATYYNWGVEILRAADEKGEPTLEHKEKFKQALPYIEKVAEQKADDLQVWETLGTIYAQLGMQDKAIKAFDRADKIRTNK